MKRVDLVRHLEAHGCRLLREGGSHSVRFAFAAVAGLGAEHSWPPSIPRWFALVVEYRRGEPLGTIRRPSEANTHRRD